MNSLCHALCRALSVALVALSFSGTLYAQSVSDVADEAEVLFRLGSEAFRSRDYDAALSHFFASNRLAPNRNVIFNIARSYEQKRDYVEAYRYYLRYAEEATPEELAEVQSAMRRVEPYVAMLDITTTPPGATLYINRKDLGSYGQSPRKLALAPGTYTVLVEHPGYLPATASNITLEVGQVQRVAIAMERVLGSVQLSGRPEGAMVVIDDPADIRVVGNIPGDFEISPGRARITVSQDGFVPVVEEIEVKPNETVNLAITLERQSGALVVRAEESNALILLDGQPIGFTPVVVPSVPVGQHRLVVTLSGFRDYATIVEILPDEQTIVDAALELADEVSAASRTAESIESAPASVSVITRREIAAFGYTDLYDALRGTRGLYGNNNYAYKFFGVRGFAPFGQWGNRMLLQIDGHTLNDNWIGQSLIEFDLLTSLAPIERIEVIRGPGSALYGTGAFFGVINLTTPTRLDQYRVKASVGTMSTGLFRAFGELSTPLGEDGGAWVAGGAMLGQAQPSLEDGEVQAGSVLGKVWWRDWTLQALYHQRVKSILTGAFGVILGDPNTQEADSRAYVEVRFEPQLTRTLRLLAKLYLDHYAYDGTYVYEDEKVDEDYRGTWLGLDLRLLITPLEALRITVGSEYQAHLQNDAGEGDDRTKHPYHTFSVYTVGDWTLTSWFALSLGGRFDGWYVADLPKSDGTGAEDRFFSAANPRLALIFKPFTGNVVKVLGGRAFRAPSIYEMTYADGLTQIPSPNLDPEVIWTGELEVSQRIMANLVLIASVYFNHITGLIVQRGSATAEDPLYYVNETDAVATLGTEVELQRDFRHGWLVSLAYAFQQTRIGSPLSGEEIVNSPEHMLSLKVIAPLVSRALGLASRVTYESRRLNRNGSQGEHSLLWDLAFSGESNVLGLQYSLGVRNLLDWRYSHPAGDEIGSRMSLRQPGRTVYFEMTARF